MPLILAIVGRPNVGKSTLFNRLVGKRLAIVDDTPGVTRDRREGEGRLADLRFTVIDTAGLEEANGETLEGRMREQTERALGAADVVLMLVDARAGITPVDQHFAQWLRARGAPVILVANKCEGRAGEPGYYEAFGLGLGDPLPLSAEHGEGLHLLYEALMPYADAADRPAAEPERFADDEVERADGGDEADGADGADGAGGEEAETRDSGPLQLAIVGRPNVGKSTLINRLLGEERLLTGPEAGITRDSIAVEWTFRGRAVRLIDTAGLRRKARVVARLEGLSVEDTLRAIRFAHVVVLTLDASLMLEKQDLTIARLVVDEGRALVIAANKWDAVADRNEAIARLRDRLETSLPQVRGIPVVTLSALTGRGTERLMPAVIEAYQVWNRRVSTARLNRWLEEVTAHHPPPLAAGRRVRIRYLTQAKARPPTFVLFTTRPDALKEGYLRYLTNGLRDAFDLPGVPVRMLVRKGKNPYAKD